MKNHRRDDDVGCSVLNVYGWGGEREHQQHGGGRRGGSCSLLSPFGTDWQVDSDQVRVYL